MTEHRADGTRPTTTNIVRDVEERLASLPPGPLDRLAARRAFYRRHGRDGDPRRRHGFGRSELHFLAWELRRGTLGGRGRPASRWWSGVNSDLVLHSELAAALVDARMQHRSDVPPAVLPWLTYLDTPSPVTWYRAHNASVVRSYLARDHEAAREPAAERRFMGQVLVRLLGAQALVESGRVLPWLSELADPRGDLVARALRITLLYPPRYPLAQHERFRADELARAGFEAAEGALWRPGLSTLFHAAARWLELPQMTSMLEGGRLLYPRAVHEPTAQRPVAQADENTAQRPVAQARFAWSPS